MDIIEKAKKLLSNCCFGKKNESEVSISNNLKEFKENISDLDNFALNINDENFLHYLMYDLQNDTDKIKFIEIFNKSELSSSIKTELFLQKNKDGETVIEYLADSINEMQYTKYNQLLLIEIFGNLSVSDKLTLFNELECKDCKENLANVITNFDEDVFIKTLCFNNGKMIDFQNMNKNDNIEFIKMLRHTDEDNESVFTAITDLDDSNLSDEELISSIEEIAEKIDNKQKQQKSKKIFKGVSYEA